MRTAPSTGIRAVQTALSRGARVILDAMEIWLESERDQLALWLPVLLGTGIGLWVLLPVRAAWAGVILLGCACALTGFAFGQHRRIGQV
ncbi:MAG: competence protein ComEC, partial [Alphaproteobacteria bacterium]|nr:competence protein ComEC [Alphaproteobacteria bacterium]